MIDYENLAKANAPFFEDYGASFKQTMENGWYILGDNVRQFEEKFAAYLGAKYCVGVASGLDALVLALRVCDLPPDSEIIVPSNTYVATILAIMQCGFKPVLVEPDIATYNINPQKIEKAITKKTKAIMIVHLYGKSCQMNEILAIRQKYNLKLIEDCAQAHGSSFQGRKTGTFGDLGAFSFYPTKNLGCLGDGGAIVTDNKQYYEKLKMYRNYGSQVKYYNEVIGYNSRLDEVQAGFLLVKLACLDEINEHKRALAEIYFTTLNQNVIKPVKNPDFYDIYHIFNIRHQQRDQLRQHLLDNGIKTEIHYPVAPHRQKCMIGILDHYNCPISEAIHQTTLSLPISFFHTKEDIYCVCDIINKFLCLKE